MRTILSTLSLQELFIVLNSSDIDELPKLFTQQQYEVLLGELIPYGAHATVSISNEALVPALLAAANPIDFLWTLTSLISLGSAFEPLSIIFLGFTVLLICAFFYQNQQELYAKKSERFHYLQLTALKILAGDLILERIFSDTPKCKSSVDLSEDYVVEVAFANADRQAQNRRIPAPIIPAFSVFFSISTTIFISYLWGLSSIFAAAGFVEISTSMVSLTGLGIIALFGFTIGLFFAVNHFLDHYTQEKMQFSSEALQDQVIRLKNSCRERYLKYEYLQLLQAQIQAHLQAHVNDLHLHQETLPSPGEGTPQYAFQMFKLPTSPQAAQTIPRGTSPHADISSLAPY